MSSVVSGRVSFEDYLELERGASDERYELIDGVVVAMAGASPRHNHVKRRVADALGRLYEGCFVASSDQRVRARSKERYVYPDVVVACRPTFDDERPRSLITPDVVVEVLSTSTLDRDRGPKLDVYRECSGLDDILFVHVDRVLVEQHHRTGPDTWLVQLHRAGALTLGARGSLEVEEIYRGLDALPDDERGQRSV